MSNEILRQVSTPAELAEKSGYTCDNIRRITPDLVKAGLARKAGKTTLFETDKCLRWMAERPETRGRKKLK